MAGGVPEPATGNARAVSAGTRTGSGRAVDMAHDACIRLAADLLARQRFARPIPAVIIATDRIVVIEWMREPAPVRGMVVAITMHVIVIGIGVISRKRLSLRGRVLIVAASKRYASQAAGQ